MGNVTLEHGEFYSLVGEGQRNDDGSSRQDELFACLPGEAVRLVRQPDNRFDKNAILVISDRGIGIGYISSEDAIDLAAELDDLKKYRAQIHELTGGLGNYPSHGCVISLVWGNVELPEPEDLDDRQIAFRRTRARDNPRIDNASRNTRGQFVAQDKGGCAFAMLFAVTVFFGVVISSGVRASSPEINKKVEIEGNTYRVFVRGSEVKVFNKSAATGISMGRTVERRNQMRQAVKLATGCEIVEDFWRNQVLAGAFVCDRKQ